MNDAAPIDHKDEPGPYREEVRRELLEPFGGVGEPVTRSDELIGRWDVFFCSSRNWQSVKQAFAYEFREDGSAGIEVVGQGPQPDGEWRLNDDRTFTLSTWCAPIPQYNINEPIINEVRCHINRLPDGRFVMWNGDGSLVKLLSRHADG
jgi:hypothetical protein